jgi:hypothetical protein
MDESKKRLYTSKIGLFLMNNRVSLENPRM